MKKLMLVVLAGLLVMPVAMGCAKRTTETTTAYEKLREAFLNDYVYFDFDKYDISPDGAAVCQVKQAFMAEYNVTTEIQGHCDERGTEVYNMALGDRRAKATFNYMRSLGVDAARMTTVSYGEERPLDPGHNEAAWAKNRRAQFVVTSEAN